ncbi:Nif3-like dinuclear metal center hexameric protein [Glutamicibacter nicotianae]|uniref:Nif3-like dinuclear metal center hexameric protein n=1 Tax=Glutamicibacter nicotianae TaxID=37929 RepID=UPI00195B8409|nr:Nif3-like dinuclear metal center hexameric protein [Glutamicibacter nicotianae]MBM7768392.1 dinuclear metal center YbgI/SA1388 family protein [Glutamicibacter nicotianae]
MQSKANNSQDLGKSNVSPEASTLKPVTEAKPEQPVEDASAAQTTLGNVLEAAEELWPKSLAEDWDAVGLVTGRTGQQISKIVMAVDPTLEVIEDAIERGADLLITHHPLLLRGVTQVAGTTFKGEAIHRLIESGTALLTAHTNADSAIGGVNDALADAFGLKDCVPLVESKDGLPEEGLGRVGFLEKPMKLDDFAERVYTVLPAVAGGVRVAGERNGIIRKVALCGGAGDSLFDAVRSHQADVYVTADLRHHPASEAREAANGGFPYLIDVSHFASEWVWLSAGARALGNVLNDLGHAVEIEVSQVNSDPWDFVLTP